MTTFAIRNNKQSKAMITALEFVKVCKAYQYDAIPNNICTLNDRNDLKPVIFGEKGMIYAIGCGGIPAGLYLYLYLNCEKENDLYTTIEKVMERERSNNDMKGFVDALGVDAEGQTIAVIGIEA